MTRKPGSLPGNQHSAQLFDGESLGEARKPSASGSRDGKAFLFPARFLRTPSAASARRESGRRSPAFSVKSKVESLKSRGKSRVQSRKSKVTHRRVSQSPCRDCSRSCCAQRQRARRRFGERSLTPTVALYPERE